jgi:hypothetical protein
MHMNAKKPRKYVDHVYSNRFIFYVACHFNCYGGKSHGEITI